MDSDVLGCCNLIRRVNSRQKFLNLWLALDEQDHTLTFQVVQFEFASRIRCLGIVHARSRLYCTSQSSFELIFLSGQ